MHLTDIPQIAAVSTENLPRLKGHGKLDAPPDPPDLRLGGPTPHWPPKIIAVAVIRAHLSLGFRRTHDTGTLHAVELSGGGRSSAISRKTSANRFLGMATSAIWKAT